MDTPNEQKADGMLDELKGKVKQAVGGLTGDKSMQGEGLIDEAKGNTKQTVADGRKALGEDEV